MVVEEMIPEKYKVDINGIVKLLKDVGFTIDEIGYGHLFFFLFAWIERFIPFSKSKAVGIILNKLMLLENKLLEFNFFKRRAELFYIICKR